ncbi:Mce family protein [Gordonia effusa NBRC 100432]|uniref:Mce family protein n=1 Tax=Gordonia effusa NBRC 100432 TaxID=1077974 RepID=H0R663_9ACTN|nr:MCE family protein [Gordonia effusa]GAB20564.1 Mce family protein [Gordonia effusa NBRC 100432]
MTTQRIPRIPLRWLVVALVLVATAIAVVAMVTARTDNRLTIHAQFTDAAGLYVGNEVTILGAPVGRIDSISPGSDTVTVTVSLPAGTVLPAEVSAVALAPSVIADRHIELTPAYTSGPQLEDDSTIPITRTRTPVSIDSLVNSIDDLAAAFATAPGDTPINDYLTTAERNLAGNGTRISATLHALSNALKTGSTSAADLKSLISSLNSLSGAAAKNSSAITTFSDQLAEASQILAANGPAITESLAGINSTVNELSKLLKSNRKPLSHNATQLNKTLSTLKSHSRDITEFVDIAPLLFDNLDRSVDRKTRRLRVHFLTDKSLVDTDLLNTVCQRLQMRSQGCRTGKVSDMGPDLGLATLLLGLGNL